MSQKSHCPVFNLKEWKQGLGQVFVLLCSLSALLTPGKGQTSISREMEMLGEAFAICLVHLCHCDGVPQTG